MTATVERPAPAQRPPSAPERSPVSRPWTSRRAILWALSLAFIAASVWGIRRSEVSLTALIDGWPQTRNLLDRMLPPFIPREDFDTIFRAVLDTFFMAFAGTAIAVALAVPLAFCAARNTMPIAPIRWVARAIIVFTRAVPTIVFAIIFVRVWGIGVLPGIVAIGVHAVGMIGKLLADAAESIEPGPREGVQSTGAGPMQDLSTGVWSQMVPTVISVTLYRLEIDFRGATLLGLVGAGGIGLIIRGYQGNLRYSELLGVTILMMVLVIFMELLSAMARKAILGTPTNADGNRFSLLSMFRSGGPMDDMGGPIAVHALNSSDQLPGDFGGASTQPTTGRSSTSPPWTPERIKLNLAGLAGVVLLVLSFIIPDVSIREFFQKLPDLREVSWRLVPKNFDWLTDRVIGDLIETVAMGFAATFLGLLLAVPFSFLAASNTSPGRWTYRISRFFMVVVRSIPDLVLAVILVAAIGLGPRTGVLALAVGMFGFSTKLFADAIEEVRQGPRDGVVSSGAGSVQELGTGVVPQVLPTLVGHGLYLLDISLRSSTVLGIIGAGGIGFLLNNAARTLNFETVGGIVLSIFVIVYAIELLATWVRKQVI